MTNNLDDNFVHNIIKAFASCQKSTYIPECPRCGLDRMPHFSDSNTFGALSRRADIYICPKCGDVEAMEDYCEIEKRPLSEWALFGNLDIEDEDDE